MAIVTGSLEASSTTMTSTSATVWAKALATARCTSRGRSWVGMTMVAAGVDPLPSATFVPPGVNVDAEQA